MGYINITAPGPVMLMKDRLINGAEAPDAIFVKKGNSYDFKLTIAGRQPGRWHVHPTFAVEGAGTLIGPGQWITIQDPPGHAAFTNPLPLLNGYTVDLERYNLPQLTIWHWLFFAIGLVWVLYWVVPKPGIPRLAVSSQIPLNSDGRDVGLTSHHDHRVANWFAIGTLVLL